MKIIALQAENIKRLTAVTIRPDGNLVQITGKNGQGKTSVLDAIWWALAGKRAVQAQPIRKGSKSAMVRLDLGEMIVTRRFREGDESGPAMSISVESANGARFPDPQTLLNTLLGELSFDPLAFTRMKPAEQYEVLKRFVPDVDFDAIAAANDADYKTRTEVNRDAKRIRAQMVGVILPPNTPDEPVDEDALVAELQRVNDANLATAQASKSRAVTAGSIGELRRSATAREERAKELARQSAMELKAAADATKQADELQATLDAMPPLPAPIETTPIREKIAAARGVNANVSQKQRLAALRAEAEALETKSEELTTGMAARSATLKDAIAKAKMPIAGLSLDEGVVLLNGLPLDQASDAERLRASVAIAAALNPQLRVIRVRDGSLLDEDGIALLGAFADEHDMQVWIERVDGSGKVGFVMEDGHLKAAEAAE